MVYIINTAIGPFKEIAMYDVAHVLREVAKIKRQRDLVKASLVPEAVKSKLLADLAVLESNLALSVVGIQDPVKPDPKGGK